MEVKIILVPFNDPDEDQIALDYAFDLAKRYDARVHGFHISLDPRNVVLPYTTYSALMVYPETSIKELEEANEKNRKKAKDAFLLTAEKMGAKDASFRSVVGVAEDVIAVGGADCRPDRHKPHR